MFADKINRYICAHTCLCLLGVLLAYLPLYIGAPVQIDLDRLTDVIRSPEYSDSSKMAVGVTFPMLMNTLLEARDLPKEAVHRFCIQCLYILALLLPNALLLVPDSGHALISVEARGSLFYGSFICLLATQNHTAFWKKFLLIDNVLLQCTMNLLLWAKYSVQPQPLIWLARFFAIFSFGGIIVACVHVTVIRRKIPSTAYQNTTAQCAAILFVNCVVKLVLFISFGAQTDIEDISKGLLVGYLWNDIATYTITYALNSRTLRSEAAVLQEKLKQNKSFVAHISHELRTPLNAVNLGMQGMLRMVDRELRNQTRSTFTPFTPVLLRDTAEDLRCINMATQTALQTLNEILMYDKLDSRNVELETEAISVADLIRLSAQSFKLQAALLDLDLSYESTLAEVENVHVKVDISKFAQVLRNFISNGLKFTPRHGRVSVRASVVVDSGGDISLKQYVAEGDSDPMYSEDIAPTSSISGPTETTPAPRCKTGCFHMCSINGASKRNVTPMSPRRRIRIEVKDSGVGISQENMKRLFTKGTQFDAASLQGGGGSGLGLWISQMIVNLHSGVIGATSVLNEGSVFFVELDIHELKGTTYKFVDRSQSIEMAGDLEETDDTSATKRSPMAISRKCSFGSDVELGGGENKSVNESAPVTQCALRALVVDDSLMTRKIFLRTLESIAKGRIYDIIPTVCENGKEAVAAVQKSRNDRWDYDVIFMDDQMPIMNGVEATKAIRDLGFRNRIVMVTGNTLMSEASGTFFAQGGSEVLVKPCQLEDIERIIADIGISSC